ncbi:MAG: hypothetical protein ACLULK_06170 [Anaerovoracaceae bacterium]
MIGWLVIKSKISKNPVSSIDLVKILHILSLEKTSTTKMGVYKVILDKKTPMIYIYSH